MSVAFFSIITALVIAGIVFSLNSHALNSDDNPEGQEGNLQQNSQDAISQNPQLQPQGLPQDFDELGETSLQTTSVSPIQTFATTGLNGNVYIQALIEEDYGLCDNNNDGSDDPDASASNIAGAVGSDPWITSTQDALGGFEVIFDFDKLYNTDNNISKVKIVRQHDDLYGFFNCINKISSVTFVGSSITNLEIDNSAFAQDVNNSSDVRIESVTFPNTLLSLSIGNSAFYLINNISPPDTFDRKLSHVVFPQSLNSLFIGTKAFGSITTDQYSTHYVDVPSLDFGNTIPGNGVNSVTIENDSTAEEINNNNTKINGGWSWGGASGTVCERWSSVLTSPYPSPCPSLYSTADPSTNFPPTFSSTPAKEVTDSAKSEVKFTINEPTDDSTPAADLEYCLTLDIQGADCTSGALITYQNKGSFDTQLKASDATSTSCGSHRQSNGFGTNSLDIAMYSLVDQDCDVFLFAKDTNNEAASIKLSSNVKTVQVYNYTDADGYLNLLNTKYYLEGDTYSLPTSSVNASQKALSGTFTGWCKQTNIENQPTQNCTSSNNKVNDSSSQTVGSTSVKWFAIFKYGTPSASNFTINHPGYSTFDSGSITNITSAVMQVKTVSGTDCSVSGSISTFAVNATISDIAPGSKICARFAENLNSVGSVSATANVYETSDWYRIDINAGTVADYSITANVENNGTFTTVDQGYSTITAKAIIITAVTGSMNRDTLAEVSLADSTYFELLGTCEGIRIYSPNGTNSDCSVRPKTGLTGGSGSGQTQHHATDVIITYGYMGNEITMGPHSGLNLSFGVTSPVVNTYSASINIAEDGDFASETYGYAALTAKPIAINSTGNSTIIAGVSISNTTDFELVGTCTSISVASGTIDTSCAVRPKIGLEYSSVNASKRDTNVQITYGEIGNENTVIKTSIVTIDKLQLVQNGNATVNSKIYDGNTDATINTQPTFANIATGDTLSDVFGGSETAENASFSSANAYGGSKTITADWKSLSGSKGGNYVLPTAAPSFTNGDINRAQIVITINDQTTQQGTPLDLIAINDNYPETVTGLVAPDTIYSVLAQGTVKLSSACNVNNAINDYNDCIIQDTAFALYVPSNYEINSVVKGKLTITAPYAPPLPGPTYTDHISSSDGKITVSAPSAIFELGSCVDYVDEPSVNDSFVSISDEFSEFFPKYHVKKVFDITLLGGCIAANTLDFTGINLNVTISNDLVNEFSLSSLESDEFDIWHKHENNPLNRLSANLASNGDLQFTTDSFSFFALAAMGSSSKILDDLSDTGVNLYYLFLIIFALFMLYFGVNTYNFNRRVARNIRRFR